MGRKRATTTPIESPLPQIPNTGVAGKKFVFATFLADRSVEATRDAITQAGATVEDRLTAETHYLVLDRINPNKKSRVEKQADRLNANGAAIEVLDRIAFLTLLGLDPNPISEPVLPPGMKLSPELARKRLLAELQNGLEGVRRWNELEPEQRRQAEHYRKADLSNAKLREAILTGLDFTGANFDNASLIDALLDYADLHGASLLNANLRGADLRCGKFGNTRFDGANLKDASLRVGAFRSASFRNADLTGADLCYADVCGADFTGATLENTAFEKASYDSGTLWPRGFTPGEDMVRVALPAEVVSPRVEASRPAGEIDIGTFFKRLEGRVGKSEAGKRVLGRARDMLKAESFRLFARVESDHVNGVIRSQRSTEPGAIYSCRLTATGQYDCYSPNMPICGGMKYGGPCKHLIVLLIGLVKAGELDPTTADWWISQTKKKHTRTDEDALLETLIQYKGAEAGQIDWRPTETVPEDYYAL